MVLPDTKVHVYDYAGKADFNMGYWNPERKLGVARHSLEKIKQQLFYAKNKNTRQCMAFFFPQIEALLHESLKKCMANPNFLFKYHL